MIMKLKALFVLSLILVVTTLNSNCQFQPTPVKKSNNQITLKGKNFYLHEVLKGQTLYGISKEYQVGEEEIKQLNPDLNKKSVYPGMVLRIPDAGTGTVATPLKEAQFITHTVLPKETFFSIARKFKIKVDDIREMNPETKSGLKIGMVLKIPVESSAAVTKTISAEESPALVSVGQDDKSVDRKDDGTCRIKPFPHENDKFRLAVLLPLNIAQNDTLTYLDTLKTEHFRFYEFLEGLYLAIDSMRQEGLNLTVEVFDTERNPETIRGILNSDGLKEANLIIGPVFRNEIEIVAAFAKTKRIPMVSPLSTFDIVQDNPYAFQVRNKLPQQVELATDYLGSKFSQNLIVIGRYAEKTNPEFSKFTANLGLSLKEHDRSKTGPLKILFYSESVRKFVNSEGQTVNPDSYLSSSIINYIILPSENEVFTTELINELHQKSTAFKMHVFGMNQWVFDDIDLGNLYNVNLELYSDFDQYPFIDYEDSLVLNFCRKYKENWNIEPSKYSFQGFDIAYFFTRALFQFGPNLISSVPCWSEYLNHPTMLTPMKFKSSSSQAGFDNQALTVVRYQKELLLRRKVN
jgi:LysM repeat protein